VSEYESGPGDEGRLMDGNPLEPVAIDPEGRSPAGDEPDSAGKGGKTISCGDAFATALLKGILVALQLSIGIFLWRVDLDNLPAWVYLWLLLSGFAGGMMSGFTLAPVLDRFRWRFLWLAASSPALPIWVVTVVVLVWGVHVRADILAAVSFACAGALAGAPAGEYGWHCWARPEALPSVVFWKRYMHAMLIGAGTSLAVSCLFLFPLAVLTSGGRGIGRLGIVLIIGMFLISPSVGGLVSGCSLCGALDDRHWRPAYLAFASPAVPFIVYYGSGEELPGTRTLQLLALSVFVALAVLGSFAGYYSALYAKRRPGPADTALDESRVDGEAPDD